MKVISAGKISKVVADLCVQANIFLRGDVLSALKAAYARETGRRAKKLLAAIIANAACAKKEKLAICQDTGLPCVFIELGSGVKINGDLKAAVNKGVELGYKKAYLRNSVVRDPLLRGRPGFTPALIHIDLVRGDKLKVTVLPKGFGCENKAQLKMFKPTSGLSEIKKFIVEAVRAAGADACPPFVVGVGIGGSADYASLLAKKALLRPLHYTLHITHYTRLARNILQTINKLNIGPMGLGGKTTALAVNIEIHPTHIAGLPVAVNISCHALRSATKQL